MKRFLASFLAFAMALSLCIVPSAAAGANVTMEVAPPDGKTLTTLSKGDEVKVTVKNSAMTVNSFTCGFEFDADIFECISIEGGIELDKSKIYLVLTDGGLSPYALCDASTTTDANNNKKVGFARGSATEVKYNAGTLAIVTFKVKKVGAAAFKLYESSDGSDAFSGTDIIVTNTKTLADPYTGTVTIPEDSDLTITNTSVVVSSPAAGHEYALTKKGEAAPSLYTSTAPIKFDGLTSETEYTLYVRVKETSDHQASDASTKDIKTLSKPALEGSISLNSTAWRIGNSINVGTSGITSTSPGTLTYKWYRVDYEENESLIAGESGNSYTPKVAADVGKKIKVVVTAENYSGSLDATSSYTVSKKPYDGLTPTEPTITIKKSNFVGFSKTDNYYYVVTPATTTTAPSSGWTNQDGFSSLTPNTQYKLWYRVGETDIMESSSAFYVEFTTLKSSAAITIADPGTIVYDGSAVEVGSGKDLNYTYGGDGAVTVKWYADNNGFKDSELTGGAPTNAGTYWIGVSAAEGTTSAAVSEVTKKFTISQKDLTDSMITLGTQKTYNGSEQGVALSYDSIKDGTKILTGGTDYTVKSGNKATDVGNNTLVIEGKGNYKGTAQKDWSLVAKDVTITPNALSKTYGADNPTLTYTTDIDGDMTLKGKFDDAKSGALSYTGTKVGAYIIRIGTLKAGNNFNLKMNTTVVFFTIKQATPVITATTPRQLVNNGMEVDISNWASFTNTDSDAELTYALGSVPAGITLIGNKLKAASSVAAGATFEIKVNAYSTHNFTAPTEFTIHVTVVNKEDAGVSITTPPTSKTYGDANFSLAATKSASAPDDGTWNWTSSDPDILEIVSDAGTATPTIKVKKANTTGATLTVTYTSDTHYGSASATIIVEPKTLTAADLTHSGSITKVYDSSDNAPTDLTVSVKSGSLVGTDTLTVTGTLKYDSANVNATEITFTPDAITTGNYTLAATEVLTITGAKITAKDVKLTGGINATDRSYVKDNKTVDLTKGTLTFTGLVGSETLDVNIPATGTISDAKVGTYNVTYSGVTLVDGTGKASNYKLVGSLPTVTVNITQAAARTLADIPVSQKYTVTTGEKTIGAVMPADAGTLTYTKGTATPTSTVTGWDVDTTGKVTYTLSGGAAGDIVTLPVIIKSTNYADSTVNVVISLTAKDDQAALTLTGGTTVVYGQTLQLGTSGGSGTGAVTYAVTNVDGQATVDASGKLTPVKVGTVKVKATKAADASFNEATSAEVEITITKATPTGTPTYTAITTSGKTLADANLTVGTITPAGTISWDAGNAQSVAANTAYDWTFEPTDTVNYNNLTGSIKPYTVSHSGGGGGSYTPSYTVSVDKTENGTITVSPKSASKGDTVTITVKPDKGYELDTLKVLDKDGDKVKLTEKKGKYTFTMPASKVTVKGKFVEEAPEQIFADVPVDAYCYEAVKWAASEGITGGIGNNLFAPGRPCTRGQIVTFLWRAAGSPEPKTMSSFADVAEDAYYAKAVAWAVENGITGGTGNGKFSPDATCTRAQAVTFLYRASGSPAVSGSAAFSDVAADAYYASAVKWAEKNGITGGIGGGLFGSGNNCTRGQIVTFLYRTYQDK